VRLGSPGQRVSSRKILTPIPKHSYSVKADNTHEVAQWLAPESRVVCVDYDPSVLRHAQALLASTPEGKTHYIHADLLDTDDRPRPGEPH
jgi:S-adenosyl methyltransferase